MDLNFHYLNNDEIKLLQDIALFETQLDNATFSFKETRNKVDVIILRDNNYNIFLDDLTEEETEIIDIIEQERRRREAERREGGYDDRIMPHLPIYDGGDDVDPFDWPDDYQDLPDNAITNNGNLMFGGDIEQTQEQWVADFNLKLDRELYLEREISVYERKIDEIRRSPDSYFSKRNLEKTLDELYKLRDNNIDLYFSEPIDDYSLGIIDNAKLFQLDLRLRQLKCYRRRLVNQNNAVWWSGSLLGCYMPNRNKGRSRRVYLFIDNIDCTARNKGFNRASVLASTFIHEMFHAYYDYVDSIEFIIKNLPGVREIEEALTEYGMLRFLERFDIAKTTSYNKDAYSLVKEKLSSGQSYLVCYGLGASLYDEWMQNRFPVFLRSWRGKSIPFFELYQKIQPAPRPRIKAVDTYVHFARSINPADVWNSLRWLFEILKYFHIRISDISQHFLFNGRTGGIANQLVYRVLRYYVDAYAHHYGTLPDLVQMERDFNNRNTLFGAYHIFEESSIVEGDRRLLAKYAMDVPIDLDGGITIYPCKIWRGGLDGNTLPFIKQVLKMKSRGLIDKTVAILR